MNRLARDRLAYRQECPTPTEIPRTAIVPPKELQTPIGAKSLVMDTLMISRNLSTRIITIGATATRIIQPPHYYPYLIKNPSLSAGLTASTVLFDGTAATTGDTTASPVGVANYLNTHFHLDITAITGTWDINLLSRDPNSGNWATVQNLFSGLTATGTQYAYVADLGVAVDMAIEYVEIAAGDITFSITGTFKGGLAGTSSGLARTVFLGGRDVTTDTGYPLFEGQERIIGLGPEVELYAIAFGSIPIKVFTL